MCITGGVTKRNRRSVAPNPTPCKDEIIVASVDDHAPCMFILVLSESTGGYENRTLRLK
ncbi:MAG: hypothetical protein LBF88_12830 [Planctomycetaceae bacterium]|nr:hypothetical protein [Planctomycetaceae bacterium]